MQKKNKILIVSLSLVVLVGAALGIYFGVKNHNDSNNNNTSNKSSNSEAGSSSSSSSNGTPTSSAGATPTPSLIGNNGTMINGTLFPYYTLTGAVPPRVANAGQVYTVCTKPNTFSISYDDGPSAYTHELLDLLEKRNIRVTFFVNGFNDGCIYDPAVVAVLKRAYNSGHQIASHTWSHPKLTTLTADAITLEMTKAATALKDVLGVVPRYMRPPYGDGTFAPGSAGDVKVQTVMKNMGYAITTWDIASGDADIDDNNAVHKLSDAALMASEQKQYETTVNASPKGAPHMGLQHDTYQRTVRVITPWVLDYVLGLGYQIVPVAECLGEDPRNWYQEIGPPSANPPTTCTK